MCFHQYYLSECQSIIQEPYYYHGSRTYQRCQWQTRYINGIIVANHYLQMNNRSNCTDFEVLTSTRGSAKHFFFLKQALRTVHEIQETLEVNIKQKSINPSILPCSFSIRAD